MEFVMKLGLAVLMVYGYALVMMCVLWSINDGPTTKGQKVTALIVTVAFGTMAYKFGGM